jgi:hypothetical protein
LHHDLPSDKMRSGGPLVVSFRRTPLSAMFGVICAGCVGYHRF